MSVATEREPRLTVAPLIGVPPTVEVTVPDIVPPAPTGVHAGNWNVPIRVFHRLSKVCATGLAYWLVNQNVHPSGSTVIAL